MKRTPRDSDGSYSFKKSIMESAEREDLRSRAAAVFTAGSLSTPSSSPPLLLLWAPRNGSLLFFSLPCFLTGAL